MFVDCFSAAADEEAFEDNSEEYIRRDLEGSGKQFYTGCIMVFEN